jgi:hypothetical protein
VVVVSSAELEASTRSAGVGAVEGRVGRPSCWFRALAFQLHSNCIPIASTDAGVYRTYLARNHADFIPHQARQYVFQKWQVEVGFLDFEFGVAWVQGKRRGVCFAGFDGAGEEVESEELHSGEVNLIDSGGSVSW